MTKQGNSDAAESSAAPSSPPARIRELLARYDELIDNEIVELVAAHRQLTPVESALLESDELAGPTLARFRREHRRETRTPLRQYAGLLALLAISFAAMIWALAVHS